jgi:hypothetical protein
LFVVCLFVYLFVSLFVCCLFVCLFVCCEAHGPIGEYSIFIEFRNNNMKILSIF